MITPIKLDLPPNPRWTGRLWKKRLISSIKKIIVHQAMGELTTLGVHNYHISPECHLNPGKGAPRISYHYTIEKDGKVCVVNEMTDVLWHCKGQNTSSIGILMLGSFTGKGYVGKSSPTTEQLDSLTQLLDMLRGEYKLEKTSVYGHCDFGKPACPGDEIFKHIQKYRG